MSRACPNSANERYSEFRLKWSQQLGQKITVVGTLTGGKLGYFVKFDDWGCEIYCRSDADLPKLNSLSRFLNHTVQVIGTLRFDAGINSSGPSPATGIPEHLYFDIADSTVSLIEDPPAQPDK